MLNMIYYRQEFELAVYDPNTRSLEKIEDDTEPTFRHKKICPEYLFYSNNKAHKYPEINIYYGPYECNRIIKYRPQKLDGFITCLKDMSYNVKLIPFGQINTVEVVCMGYSIYRFDIRYLKFNMPCKDDPICLKAVDIIKEAVQRFYGDNNTTERVKAVQNYARRGTTMSISSKISLSEYDTLMDIVNY